MKDGSLRDCGYDLTISTLLGKNAEGSIEENTDDLDLNPQGIALAISEEILKLPPDVCAHALVKTSLCREGILAINIGVIDPGWQGPVSSILLNFGKSIHRLKKGEAFLRLTFHTLDAPAKPVPPAAYDRASYTQEVRRKFSKRLADSFMDFDKAAAKASGKYIEEVRSALIKYVPIASVMLAVLVLLMNAGVLVLAGRSMPQDVVQAKAQVLTTEIKQDNEKLHAENQQLHQRLDAMQAQLDKLSKKKQ